jgi:hypothetical protein
VESKYQSQTSTRRPIYNTRVHTGRESLPSPPGSMLLVRHLVMMVAPLIIHCHCHHHHHHHHFHDDVTFKKDRVLAVLPISFPFCSNVTILGILEDIMLCRTTLTKGRCGSCDTCGHNSPTTHSPDLLRAPQLPWWHDDDLRAPHNVSEYHIHMPKQLPS